jgi:serpin B
MIGRTSVMTHRRRAARQAITLGAVVTLAACGSDGLTPLIHRGNAVPVTAGSLTATDVAAAQTGFGVALLHATCAQAPDKNLLLSPTSAAEALSLLYPAATGQTADAFADVLRLPEWSPELVAAFREHTRALDGLRYDGGLEDEEAPDSLQMSNRLWTATGLEPDPRYLDDLATAFDADVQALDFTRDPQGATDRINATVADDTHGIIEKLFDSPLRPGTQAVLTNALHLKAQWADPFTGTDSALFQAPSGELTVDMMSGATGAHRTEDGWQAVELPYRDGTLSAVAVLPPEGTDPCAVDAATLAALEAAEPEKVGVRLPQMEIEQTHDLLGILTTLGLPGSGDFPALGGPLEISRGVQKTFLEVDEAGTEAAAATGVAVAVGAALPKPDVVTFDRPFLFLLTDTQTHSPLFMTVVNDPSA